MTSVRSWSFWAISLRDESPWTPAIGSTSSHHFDQRRRARVVVYDQRLADAYTHTVRSGTGKWLAPNLIALSQSE